MHVLDFVYCSFSFAIYIIINYLIVFHQKILIAEKLMISYLIVFMKAFMICNYPLIGGQFSHAYHIMSNESYTVFKEKCATNTLTVLVNNPFLKKKIMKKEKN